MLLFLLYIYLFFCVCVSTFRTNFIHSTDVTVCMRSKNLLTRQISLRKFPRGTGIRRSSANSKKKKRRTNRMKFYLLGGLVAAMASVFTSLLALCLWFGRRGRSAASDSEPKRRPSDEYNERSRLLQVESDEEEPVTANRDARETGRGRESAAREVGSTASSSSRHSSVSPKKSPVKGAGKEDKFDEVGHGVAVESKANARELHGHPTLGEQERGRYGSTDSTEAAAEIVKSTHFNASFASPSKKVAASGKSDVTEKDNAKDKLQSELEQHQLEKKEYIEGAVGEAKPAEAIPTPPRKEAAIDDSGVADEPFIQPPEDEPLLKEEPESASTEIEDKEWITNGASSAPAKVEVANAETNYKPPEAIPTPKTATDDSGAADTNLIQLIEDEPLLTKEVVSTEIEIKESSSTDVSSALVKEEVENAITKPPDVPPTPPKKAAKDERGDFADKLNVLLEPTKAVEVEEGSSTVTETEAQKSPFVQTGSSPKAAARNGIADKLNALFQPTVSEPPQQEEPEAVVDVQTVPGSSSPQVSPKPAPRLAPKPAARPKRSASGSQATPPVPVKPVVQARKQVVSFPSGVPVLPVAFGKDSPSPTLRRTSDGIRNRQQMLGPVLMGMPGMGGGKPAKKDADSEMPISFDEVCNYHIINKCLLTIYDIVIIITFFLYKSYIIIVTDTDRYRHIM